LTRNIFIFHSILGQIAADRTCLHPNVATDQLPLAASLIGFRQPAKEVFSTPGGRAGVAHNVAFVAEK
jgi:hypothetical protein